MSSEIEQIRLFTETESTSLFLWYVSLNLQSDCPLESCIDMCACARMCACVCVCVQCAVEVGDGNF